MAENPTLRQTLTDHTAVAAPELTVPLDRGHLRCLACAHRCRLAPDQEGICKVRFHSGGRLRVPWGYTAGVAADPIEKKPFHHVLPGSTALSFGMLGCDLHCAYCQNWITSQALRDDAALAPIGPTSPGALVQAAMEAGCRSLVSTYNEPLITAEWAIAVFREAGANIVDVARVVRERLLGTEEQQEKAREKLRRGGGEFVSNGNATPEVLDLLAPHVDMFKVDLKGFRDRGYRDLGGVLDNVLDTLRGLHARGIWLEVVTLVVPGLNDTEAELSELAAFLANLDPDLPWHVTGFHPDYRMRDRPATSAASLARAVDLGHAAGLRYVYAGNRPGQTGDHESTACPGCGGRLILRLGYRVLENRLAAGRCPDCDTPIPGIW